MKINPGSSFFRINQGVADANSAGAGVRQHSAGQTMAARGETGKPEKTAQPPRPVASGGSIDRPRAYAPRGSLIDIKV